MELRQLEYFIGVAAELNFSSAAERIHVVQSALSAAVGRLEKELGVELFDRSKRQIALTPAGEVFLDHAREVMLAARRAQSSTEEYRGQLMRTVALGALMTWGRMNLPAALEEFRQSHPKVTVRLRQNTTGSAGPLVAIADGQMDLALVSITSPRCGDRKDCARVRRGPSACGRNEVGRKMRSDVGRPGLEPATNGLTDYESLASARRAVPNGRPRRTERTLPTPAGAARSPTLCPRPTPKTRYASAQPDP